MIRYIGDAGIADIFMRELRLLKCVRCVTIRKLILRCYVIIIKKNNGDDFGLMPKSSPISCKVFDSKYTG